MELMDLSLEKLYKIVHGIDKERFDENVFGIIAVSVFFLIFCYYKRF